MEHEKLNYLELASADLLLTKAFFTHVFGWEFTDYGPEYSAFSSESAGMDGGFYQANLKADADTGSALVIFYSTQLEQTQERIALAGGEIIKPIFAFPGGRRFHFTEPCGNEFAVWSDS